MASKQSRGLGDSVAKFTNKTRLDRLAGPSCGCAKRQAALNRRFPYNRRLQATVPDERPYRLLAEPPPFTTDFKWNRERLIDGKRFKRFKRYGDDLEQARRDAQAMREGGGTAVGHRGVKLLARVLKFSDGYHLFTWKPPNPGYLLKTRPKTNEFLGPRGRLQLDPNPRSGDVDTVPTVFHRRFNASQVACPKCGSSRSSTSRKPRCKCGGHMKTAAQRKRIEESRSRSRRNAR